MNVANTSYKTLQSSYCISTQRWMRIWQNTAILQLVQYAWAVCCTRTDHTITYSKTKTQKLARESHGVPWRVESKRKDVCIRIDGICFPSLSSCGTCHPPPYSRQVHNIAHTWLHPCDYLSIAKRRSMTKNIKLEERKSYLFDCNFHRQLYSTKGTVENIKREEYLRKYRPPRPACCRGSKNINT